MLWFGVLQIYGLHCTYGLITGALYKVGSHQVNLHCTNHQSHPGIVNTSTKCAIEVSRRPTYGYGFTFRSGICHACRSHDALGMTSSDEFLLWSNHFIKGMACASEYFRHCWKHEPLPYVIFLQTHPQNTCHSSPWASCGPR